MIFLSYVSLPEGTLGTMGSQLGPPRKGSAFDAKQRLLQQQAQQELRKAEVKRTRLGRRLG